MKFHELLALLKQKELERSIQFFPIIEVTLLVISLFLTFYVLRRHLREKAVRTVTPGIFVFLIAVMLGLSVVLIGLWGPFHAILALAVGTGVALALADPVAGAGFLLANLFIRPWELSQIGQMSIIVRLMAGSTLFSWVFHAVRRRDRPFAILFDSPTRVFFTMATWFLFSALISGDIMAGLAAYSGSVFIAGVIFLLVSNAPEDDSHLNMLEKVLVLAVTGMIAHAFFVTIYQDNYDFWIDRLEDVGAAGNTNDIAALIVQALPIAFIPAIQPGKRMGGRLIALIVVPILLLGMWMSQSRGAMLGMVVSAGTYWILKSRNKRRSLILTAIVVRVLFAGLTVLNLGRNQEDLQGSSESRAAFLKAGLNMGIKNPIFGVGFNNFAERWGAYAIGNVGETGVRTAHNSWVLAFAETGLPGLILFIALFVGVFKKAVAARVEHPELIAALMGYAIAMTFLSHTYTIYPYVLYAMILSAARIRIRSGGVSKSSAARARAREAEPVPGI